MTKLKAWLSAARLRTLPLSVSGIIVGASLGNLFLASSNNKTMIAEEPSSTWQSGLFWIAILVTVGFQVLSNFANDYGDGVRGTDAKRQGEKRMVASGVISPKQMKIGMVITAIITFFLATVLIFMAFGHRNFIISFVFLI